MSYRRVRANATYVYEPVLIDRGVAADHAGQVVRVVNMPGCPKANTMGHCHIQTLDGQFLGMVCTNSLQPKPKASRRKQATAS